MDKKFKKKGKKKEKKKKEIDCEIDDLFMTSHIQFGGYRCVSLSVCVSFTVLLFFCVCSFSMYSFGPPL